MSLAKTICEKLTKAISFEEETDFAYISWRKAVDAYLMSKVGVKSSDLSDYNWRDAYNDGVKATSAANSAIKNTMN